MLPFVDDCEFLFAWTPSLIGLLKKGGGRYRNFGAQQFCNLVLFKVLVPYNLHLDGLRGRIGKQGAHLLAQRHGRNGRDADGRAIAGLQRIRVGERGRLGGGADLHLDLRGSCKRRGPIGGGGLRGHGIPPVESLASRPIGLDNPGERGIVGHIPAFDGNWLNELGLDREERLVLGQLVPEVAQLGPALREGLVGPEVLALVD